MKKFRDRQDREWAVAIDIAAVKALRDRVNVDIYALFSEEAKRLFADPVLLVDTLYVLCQEQCSERRMSDVDFGQAFDGDVLENAANALLEAVVDFFPQSRRRILRATIEKGREVTGQIQERAMKEIAAFSVTDLLKPTASPVS